MAARDDRGNLMFSEGDPCGLVGLLSFACSEVWEEGKDLGAGGFGEGVEGCGAGLEAFAPGPVGADDFVRKPFGKHELLARVRAVLRRNGEAKDDDDFSFGPWRVFPKRLMAERESQMIDLTPRELKLLALLAKHRGEVITRDELLNACWGLEYFPESRTLDQHVLNLRKKIEADPSRPVLIETVRGAGYRFPAQS